jgi:hypothetical protein
VSENPFTFWKRFWWGFGGAMTHEAYRLHKIFEATNTLPPFPPIYYILTPILIVGGGLMSAAWEEDKAWKCFYLGVMVGVYIAVWSAAHP